MKETNIKYYKTYRGIYKLKEINLHRCIFESLTINYFDYVISSDTEEYDTDLILNYLKSAEAKEITEEEYNQIYTTFNYLKEKQNSLFNNIKEFIDNNLNG